MRLRWIILLPLALAGCAASEPAIPSRSAPPAARIALRPEYRVFYDALADYGDWVLIEPWGYVFRPRVDFGVWRPYTNGFWAATDLYGWVWVSSEPFGWATEHYGRWFWDNYQGWVWLPGRDWAPAWVAWEANDDWVAWSPLSPGNAPDFGPGLSGGPFVYAPLRSLGSTDITSQVTTRAKAGATAASLESIHNEAERNGIRFNLGPSIERVERAAGAPIQRVRLDDVMAGRPPGSPRPAAGRGASAPDSLPSPRALRDAGDEAARDARRFTGQSTPAPPRVGVVRAFGFKPGAAAHPRPEMAPADSSRH